MSEMRFTGLGAAAVAAAVALALSAPIVYGQGSMHRPAPASSTQDSSGHLKVDNDAKSNQHIRGSVTLADGLSREAGDGPRPPVDQGRGFE